MPYPGQVVVTPPGGTPSASTPASVDVGDVALTISLQSGPPVYLQFVDIDDVFDDDYTMRLTDYTGHRYDLSMLGKAYGQVLADVRNRRNDRLQHDLLLTGVKLTDAFPAKLPRLSGPPISAEVRLFEDLLVVMPERGLMWGLPYSFVEDVMFDRDSYQVRVKADDGGAYTFAQLGKRSEEFVEELRRLLDALAARTARTLGTLLPGVPPPQISALASMMRDGRAAQQRHVDAIDPGLWARLEGVVIATDDLKQSYASLKSLCQPGSGAFGVKAVLQEKPTEPDGPDKQAGGQDPGGQAADGQAPGEAAAPPEPVEAGKLTATQMQYGREGAAEDEEQPTKLWFFCPLSRDGRPVNLVAQEITSEKGHATYLYRLMEPERFAQLSGDQLADAVGEGIARINRAILTLNFRREPIYVPQEQIERGPFNRYAVALRKLDYLKWTRQSFLGRVIHNETWQQQLQDALSRA